MDFELSLEVGDEICFVADRDRVVFQSYELCDQFVFESKFGLVGHVVSSVMIND